MLPRADITGARPLTPIEAPTPIISSTDARQETFQRLLQITIGQQLQAEVLSHLDDGTFLVRVADTSVRMSLPAGTRAGDALNMTLIATEPRPTFLLDMESGGTPATLSNAGRLINHLLQSARQENVAPVIVARTSLVGSSGTGPVQIAAALHEALSFSGLFYESHVHQWIRGERPFSELLREPQMQNGKMLSNTTGTLSTQRMISTEQNQAIERTETTADGHFFSKIIQDSPSQANTSQQNTDQLQPEMARLLNLQLDTLEHQRVQWHGELWPGQSLEWEISEDAPGSGDENDIHRTWQSSVRFDLPTLGSVSATVRLTGKHVHVQVSASTEAVANSLRLHGKELAEALEAAGSPLDSLMVNTA